jgi:hypothetical protein
MDMCERWLSHFDLATGLTVGFVGDGGGLDRVAVRVEGVEGRDVGGVGTAGVVLGGCCAGTFGIVVVMFVRGLSRLGVVFKRPG